MKAIVQRPKGKKYTDHKKEWITLIMRHLHKHFYYVAC